MDFFAIIEKAVRAGCSDIHITVDKPPLMRIQGEILPIDPTLPPLSAAETQKIIYAMLNDEARHRFEESWELDRSLGIGGVGRFRVNVLMTRKGIESVMRVIGANIPTPESLRLTPHMIALTDLPRGLVLVTGPTGSGKSTTLASLIEVANQKRSGHILTLEDPIEFIFESKKSIVRQREVGQNTKSFHAALRACLREDPDIIFVGEMRDYETIALAITAAETGHLCFGTLHTQDAPSTIARMIDVFPANAQAQIITQLANSLKAVIAQVLLPHKNGRGRVAARELMIGTQAVSNLIRERKTHMIYSAIEAGRQYGMFTMDFDLAHLVKEGQVAMDIAVAKAHNPDQVRQWIIAPSASPVGIKPMART